MKVTQQPLFPINAGKANISVAAGGIAITDESWQRTPISDPFSRLYYVTDGSGVIYTENETVKLEPGYVYLAPCGIRLGFYSTDSVEKLYFHIGMILPNGYDFLDGFDHLARLPFPIEDIKKMEKWYLSDDFTDHLLLKGEIDRTVLAFVAAENYTPVHRLKYSPAVTGAIQYIRKNLAASLTVQDVADHILCSRGRLSAYFKEELGQSTARYIENLLMIRAQTMLLYTDYTIGEISTRLGFCDQFYFSRRFKQYFSLSPKEYRKRKEEP